MIAGKEIVLPAQGQRADGILDAVVARRLTSFWQLFLLFLVSFVYFVHLCVKICAYGTVGIFKDVSFGIHPDGYQ